VHVHTEASEHASHHGVGSRPFIVGLVHGMAGSAALMLFVLSTIDSGWMGFVYVAVFGLGTIAGMLVMSALIGLPFASASRRLSGIVERLRLAVGIGSLVFDLFYTWRVAVDDRLFASLLG
jgi:sulfite exporter TauE/SafE